MTSDESKPRKSAAPEESEEAVTEEAAEAAAEAPEEPAAGEEAAAGGEPEDPLSALTAEVASLKDQLLRALAETENTRRRAERDRAEAAKYGISGLARDLLVIVDNLRRAIESVPEDKREDETVAALLAGVEMTEHEFLKLLERHGVRRVDPLGEKFDHNLHQAMFEIPTADHPEGTVAQVVQPGYVIADRLLRPAMVGVAKAPPAGGATGGEAGSEPAA